MKIGQLAESTGLTPKTIRFYESERLLPAPARTYGSYRAYGPGDVERLDFIRRAKRLGLSLDELLRRVKTSPMSPLTSQPYRRKTL